jgi:RND family efflux transporter MFP subunit
MPSGRVTSSIAKIVIILVVSFFAAAGGYYYYFFLRMPTVKTSVAILAPVSEVVMGTGVVEPVQWAKIVPYARKRVVELCSCEGQWIKQGQVLGRQDDAEERSALHELEIRSAQLDKDLKRLDDDRRRGIVSKSEYERHESELKELNTRVAAQKDRLDALVFRAPMDGMVLRRDGEVGEIAGPTDVLFWVGPPLPTQVVAEINEEEITKIAVGQKVLLRNDAFAERALPAQVSQITPKGDPTRKTFRVYLRLPNDTPFRIGMTAEANIVTREKTAALVVPLESIINNAVQVVADGRIQRVPVTIGIRGTRFVEVSGNLSNGSIVVSPARNELAERTQVKTGPSPNIAAVDQAPVPNPATTSDPRPLVNDPDTQVVAEAMSAHIQSVVNDARRNVSNFKTRR